MSGAGDPASREDVQPLSRVPTPARLRRTRPVAAGLNCRPADEVPGAVLPPDVAQRLAAQIDALNDHTRQARLRFDMTWSPR